MKKQTKTIIWLAVGVGLLGFFVYKIPPDDFKTAIRRIEWLPAILALFIYFVAQTLLGIRWVILLRVHSVYISHFKAIKLTYLGLFYNNFMPGSVGGDLLKGWAVTKHSKKEQRLEAAVTVFVDRLVGLIGMILVGALASLFVGSELSIPVGSRDIQVRVLIWLLLAGLIFVSVIFLSKNVRRCLMLSLILEKLPFAKTLHKIDQAIRIYRGHPGVMVLALVLTAVIQGLAIVAIWTMSQALQLENVRFIQCLIIMPIVWLISAAIPVPGGLGVMEVLFIPFFARAIDPSVVTGTDHWEQVKAMAAALALLNRLMICACSLPGALVPIFGGHLPQGEELEQIMEKDDLVDKKTDQEITKEELD